MKNNTKGGLSNYIDDDVEIRYEVVKHQFKSKLRSGLIEVIEKMRNRPDMGDLTLEEMAKWGTKCGFSKVIKKHTNISINLKIIGVYGMFVGVHPFSMSPVIPNENASLRSIDMNIKKIKDNNLSTVGGVDLNTGKVLGHSASITTDLSLPFDEFIEDKKTLSDIELVAIILHEIGHVFTNYELTSHTTLTSMVMENVIARLQKSETALQRYKIVTETKREMYPNLDVDKFKTAKKQPDSHYITLLGRADLDVLKSEFGETDYGKHLSEELADNYAVRHGAGAELASGLGKVYTELDRLEIARIRATITVTSQILTFKRVGEFGATLLIGALLPFAPIFVGVYVILRARYIYNQHYSPKVERKGEGEHPSPYVRWEAIKRQMIDSLKDSRNTPENRKSLLRDINECDKLMLTVKTPKANAILGNIGDMIMGSGEKAKMDNLRNIENMANNSLFKSETIASVILNDYEE